MPDQLTFHQLFSPLSLGRHQAPNRLCSASLATGLSGQDGRLGEALARHYRACARGGAGLIVTEAMWPAGRPAAPARHLALYDDEFIPDLGACLADIQAAGSLGLVMLDQPLDIAPLSGAALAELGAAFVTAAWRAHTAGANGVMLSTTDGGPFAQLVSPLRNQRDDQHGAGLDGRTWLLLSVVEGITRWLGRGFLVGVRLLVEEFAPGGLTLQDARVIARRLVSAGVGLIEVSTAPVGDAPLAQFPGWRLPLAEMISSVADVPVLVGGQLDDALLAEGALAEGSADLIDVAERLLREPDWPRAARAALERGGE